ncbi:MAG: hypothetical protein IJ418_20305 [Clostridia bacterium]|nr:hypothetical protein [Clostridia bacterium]
MMHLPLVQWTLHGNSLPERLFDVPKTPVFSLPGADALSAFADLIGGDEAENTQAQPEGAPYSAGGFFEDDLAGELTLSREIDFGAFCGDRALLTFAYLAGSGEILLDDRQAAVFGVEAQADLRHAYDMTGMPCALCVDLTDALLLGRMQTLSIRFCASRPAGVIGAAFLSVTSQAHLCRVSIQPDAKRRTMTVRARISAKQEGRYILRVQEIPGKAGRTLPPARQTDVELDAGAEKGVQLSMEIEAPAFVPGQAYAAPALKIQLLGSAGKRESLCDDALLMCGYGASAPKSWLPLTKKECLGDCKALCDRLIDLGIHAVSLPMPAPDRLYQEMTRRGIAAVQHVSEEIRPMFTRYPCVSLSDFPLEEGALSPQAAAWQMAGSVAFPRAVDGTVSSQDMLLEASGRALDGEAQSVRDALSWLRAVQIRMRAEAVRQGRYQGTICSAGEWDQDDIRDALKTAFAPVHLSALPLSGAWWTGTRFSASLEAFISKEMLPGEGIEAMAVLEDDDGGELARFSAPCKGSGYLGVIEAVLPDHPCVLTLHCALLRGGETIEESTLPIYVGDRGPLEAAF